MLHWRWLEVTNAYLVESEEPRENAVFAKCEITDLSTSSSKMKSAITSWMTMEFTCHVMITSRTTDAV
jgi:hypothetical protein